MPGLFDDLIPNQEPPADEPDKVNVFADLIPRNQEPPADQPETVAQNDQEQRLQRYGVDTQAPEDSFRPEDHPIAERAATSVVNYAKSQMPHSQGELLRMANIPTDWSDPTQLAEFAAPGLKLSIDQYEQAKARYNQIQSASQTPDWSQERMDAGVGTALDLLQLAAMFKGGEHFSPEEVAAKSPEGKDSAPLPKNDSNANVASPTPVQANIETRTSPETGFKFAVDPKTGEAIEPVPTPDEQTRQIAESPSSTTPGDIAAGQQPTAPAAEGNGNGVGARPELAPAGEAERQGAPAGTSNRVFQETYGDQGVPQGQGVDTGELLDNARAAISSGDIDPYSILSKTRAKGIANPEEYAALAAEHERLVNRAVALEKTGDPTAPEAARQANDFATAIQPHKTAASDLMRLFQGDLNYDMSTTFGIDQYMKSELGRGIKPSEEPMFTKRAQGIRQAQTDVVQAVGRSDAKVQGRYAKVRDIPIEEAAARVKQLLSDCLV